MYKRQDWILRKKRHQVRHTSVAVGYEVHQTRGKTKTARRAIELDNTTMTCLLYTSDAADERSSVDLGGRRIIKKKKKKNIIRRRESDYQQKTSMQHAERTIYQTNNTHNKDTVRE